MSCSNHLKKVCWWSKCIHCMQMASTATFGMWPLRVWHHGCAAEIHESKYFRNVSSISWEEVALLCAPVYIKPFYCISTHYTRGQRRKVPTKLYITLKPSDICSVVFIAVQEDIILNSVLLWLLNFRHFTEYNYIILVLSILIAK